MFLERRVDHKRDGKWPRTSNKTSTITNHGRKSSFKPSLEDEDRERPSRYFFKPKLRVKLAHSRDTDLAFQCFREMLFGCQGFQSPVLSTLNQTRQDSQESFLRGAHFGCHVSCQKTSVTKCSHPHFNTQSNKHFSGFKQEKKLCTWVEETFVGVWFWSSSSS